MKVLVLNGSPKKRSDTMILTRSFLGGLNQDKNYHIEIIDVINKKIKPCMGCFGCWQVGDGTCVQKDDDVNDILQKYAEADILIWSFPLYCYAMPSHLKALLDRTIPLVQMKMIEVDGRIQHVPLVDFSKKRTIVIAGCGFPDWDGNFEGLRIMCNNCFENPTQIFVPETPMLNSPSAQVVTGKLIMEFEMAGREYAEKNTISQDTIQRLETPMISKEEYLNIVNGSN